MYVNVTIHSPVGKFAGALSNVPMSQDEAIKYRDTLQLDLGGGSVQYLFLFQADNTIEMLVPARVLENSVFSFTIDGYPCA